MRRVLLSFVITLLLAGRADAFTFVVTEPNTPLVPTSVIDLADRLGYFAREGVDVHLLRVNGTPTAIAALSAGQADMAEISLESLLKLNARGETRFRAVSSPARSLSYVIAARDGIGSLAQFSGALFGIGQPGTLDATLSRTVLHRLGVDPDRLKMVSVGSPMLRLKALRVGKIDATTISYASWMSLPDKTGLHVLLSKEAYFRAAPVVAKVNVVGNKALHERRAEIVKVTAALLKLARDFAAHPGHWVAAMREARPDVPADELRALAASYVHDWCVDGCFDPAELQSSAQFFRVAPGFPPGKAPPLAAWSDASVLHDARAALGTERLGAAR